MPAPVIVTRGLSKRYGDTTAVADLDLEIEAGEVFGLLGPNGAGKTTTILMLLGLTEPTNGNLEVLGFDPRRDPLEVKARVGYLPDSVGFYEGLTGRQNLRYTARLNRLDGDDVEERIAGLLDLTGLADVADRKVGGYSRGMRQRLGLADALVKRPAVLILDEPTVNIDPEGVAEILALVRRLADAEGVTVLLSSHLLQQVQEVCDRIGIFVAGRLVAVGTVEELSAHLGDEVIIEVVAGGPEVVVDSTLASLPGVVRVERDGEMWVVAAVTDLRVAVGDALHDAGCSVSHLRRRGAELDTIYRSYFHGDAVAAGGESR